MARGRESGDEGLVTRAPEARARLSTLLAFAVWLTRKWTQVYTWGIERDERDRRRQEIDSDLWESEHEEAESDAQIAARTLARLAGGIVDDLQWRAEHPVTGSARVLLAIATTGVAAAALWMFFATQAGPVPSPPPAPAMTQFFNQRIAPPPPPPPPPPPSHGRPTRAHIQ